MIAGWSPGIGDPTAMGWLTVFAYLLASLLAMRAAVRDASANANVWRGIALFLALLGINKQLDLQSLLTALARHEARSGGWYENRRPVQEAFILSLLALCGGATVWLLHLTRRHGRTLRGAAVGMILLLVFICVRAISFHDVDSFLRSSFATMTMNHALELGGIAIVGLAAWSTRRPDQVGGEEVIEGRSLDLGALSPEKTQLRLDGRIT